ncbi:MAG: hypothetical protein [Bacteriophage sp.]|nr:MAG: hypothetical protein [Bacteriophage sp.]
MDNLSVDFLKKHNAFTGRPVAKTIAWENGKGEKCEALTYVRPVGYQSARGDLMSKDGVDAVAMRIAAHICDASGKPVFTYEDIIGTADKSRGALDANLTIALLSAIGEVITAGKTNPSRTKKNSSAN